MKKSSLNLTATVQVSGHYRMYVSSPTKPRRLVAEFDNLITDDGLDHIGVGGILQCVVGTGSTAPTTSDTALETQAGASFTVNAPGDTTSTYVAGSPPYHQSVITFTFGPGMATGNFTEIGVRATAAPVRMFSRSLILDGVGATTEISVAADETLTVDYVLRLYPPTTDRTGSVTLDSIVYGYTGRAYRIQTGVTNGSSTYGWGAAAFCFSTPQLLAASGESAWTGAIVAYDATSGPTGSTTLSTQTATPNTYVLGSYEKTGKISYGLPNAIGNISSILVKFNGAAYQLGFSPAIPKLDTQILELNVKIAWARRP